MSRARRADLAVVPDLERELDELYGLPLGEFTAARNELAMRLKKAGQERDAERVAGLGKPAISAWAVNQLARRDAERLRELLEAGEALVDAQKAALAGKRAEGFDAASRRQRDAVRRLVPAAVGVLEGAGHRPSDAVRERIASSLRAASLDPEGRRLLALGRLEEDFESAGLDLLAGFVPAQGKRAAAPTRPDDTRLRKAREQVEAAREEEAHLAEEAAEAEREAERAAAAADEAAERARRLAAEAARAGKAVVRAEEALARLERK